MEIERDIIKRLLEWKKSRGRRPLLIQGARQIGKTWVMRKFGERYYDNFVYFNFESNDELRRDYQQTKEPKRIIELLRLYSEKQIVPEKTLIIFDEIQECPEALNSLKYFCEDAPEYHIMAAGSLLGVAINKHQGFPVGKVDFLKMYPITFAEYLRTIYPSVYDYLDHLEEISPLPSIIEGKMWEAYRKFQICGGMPKAAVASLENLGHDAIKTEQNEILTSYFLDFSKHAPISIFPKIAAVWRSLPSQLSKENRKFVYKVVKDGARAREYEDALIWLREAGLIYEIFCISKPGLPLSAYDDLSAFKIYLLDMGLLRELANIPPSVFTTDSTNFEEFKGALTENAILQDLIPVINQSPRYWVSNGTAEIDFIIQDELDIIPVEVKSADNTSSKSLSVYINKFSPSKAVILSSKPLSFAIGNANTKIYHIPLPLTHWLPKLINL